MKNIYCYDKSFEGLLSVVFDAYTRKVFPDALQGMCEAVEASAPSNAAGALPLLPANSYQVSSSPEKAGRVFTALRKKLSAAGVHRLLAAWLAEEPGGDLLIFRFIRLVLDSATLLEANCGDATVFELGQMARRVNRERHKLMGFVRFQKTAQGVYFSAIAPRHNVLPLLLNHFTQRLADQPWIIYDCGRRYGMYYDLCGVREIWLDSPMQDGLNWHGGQHAPVRKTMQAGPSDPVLQDGRLNESLLAEGETLVQNMWRGYFQAAVIKERINPKLQRQFMPRHYWPYLTELAGK
ncbi:MAG: TIGR03915 family putative DNA repair protein [Deltaproteobacteria bacterium]|jgi:probable DNA metabolism protein|nr:TIGR03915 family putative DNA repair protein [Deltaproteobacteria bacterium]